jgi:hypothetical protein
MTKKGVKNSWIKFLQSNAESIKAELSHEKFQNECRKTNPKPNLRGFGHGSRWKPPDFLPQDRQARAQSARLGVFLVVGAWRCLSERGRQVRAL